jgi:hypothetical protein
MGASREPDLVGPGRLSCYAIGTTASADPRGIFLPAQHWDGSPGKVIRHSTQLRAQLAGTIGRDNQDDVDLLESGIVLVLIREHGVHNETRDEHNSVVVFIR